MQMQPSWSDNCCPSLKQPLLSTILRKRRKKDPFDPNGDRVGWFLRSIATRCAAREFNPAHPSRCSDRDPLAAFGAIIGLTSGVRRALLASRETAGRERRRNPPLCGILCAGRAGCLLWSDERARYRAIITISPAHKDARLIGVALQRAPHGLRYARGSHTRARARASTRKEARFCGGFLRCVTGRNSRTNKLPIRFAIVRTK